MQRQPCDWLKLEYEKILREEYHLSNETIEARKSRQDIPAFSTLVDAQNWFDKNFHKIGKRHSSMPNEYWNLLLDDLLGVLPSEHFVHDVPLFVGQVPDVRLNACSEELPGPGYLILVIRGWL